ncbi:MAG: glycosyltransferase [Vicinamibacteria bacterium]|nr:glycosyltransferase [Vicinamibacteria bacterium]
MTDTPMTSDTPGPKVSVIVPFHRGLAALDRVLSAIVASDVSAEIIVVANGHEEDLTSLSRIPRLHVLSLPNACGPAVARNRGAAIAAGEVVVFVDADVIPHPTAIPGMLDLLAREPDVAGVFGAYDHQPGEKGFFSQYRNLAHAFVHEQANPDARTFWAGLGALRTSGFRAVGGFDERFQRPSIEDIDLGYRLSQAGYRLRLDSAIRGTHLKRWTLLSSIVIDVRDRGVPWTQTLLKFGAIANDLNISWAERASVALAYLLVGAGLVGLVRPTAFFVALAALAGFTAANWPLLRAFASDRGPGFALGVLAGQLVHHLCNGVSLVVGTTLWFSQRRWSWRTKWTLPPDVWRRD